MPGPGKTNAEWWVGCDLVRNYPVEAPLSFEDNHQKAKYFDRRM